MMITSESDDVDVASLLHSCFDIYLPLIFISMQQIDSCPVHTGSLVRQIRTDLEYIRIE